MSISTQKTNNTVEFILLASLLTALNPLSLDAILPAMSSIGDSFTLENQNDTQLLISSLIFGLVFGELISGPICDSIGRKKVILIGIGFYIIGTVLALTALSFSQLLLGRFIQGFGVAGPKIASRAMIRDRYEGDEMARVLSLILMVVIFIPMIAPAYGQVLLKLFNWQAIFISLMMIAIIAGGWLVVSQPETLAAENRRPLSVSALFESFMEIIRHRQFMCCTIIAGLTFGMQLLFISMAPQILNELYFAGDLFAFYFAVLALSIAIALLINSKLVIKYGMLKMIKNALRFLIALGIALVILTWYQNGVPSFGLFMLISFCQLFAIGIIFGNMNALAMKSMGHIAGYGFSVIASLSSLIAVSLAVPVGRFYSDSMLPLAIGYTIFPVTSYIILMLAFNQTSKK